MTDNFNSDNSNRNSYAKFVKKYFIFYEEVHQTTQFSMFVSFEKNSKKNKVFWVSQNRVHAVF